MGLADVIGQIEAELSWSFHRRPATFTESDRREMAANSAAG